MKIIYMVDGNEYIFENIGQALDYVLHQEQKDLAEDRFRQQPPQIIRCNDGCPLSVDSIDYPLTAFFNKVNDEKFVMTRLLSGRYSLKPNLKSRKFLFRGESEFHSPCRPSVFRKSKQKRYTAEMARGQEMMLLMLSHPLVQLLDMGIILKGTRYRFEMNLYGLTQHYYNKSHFLDLTSDPRVACFFATSKYDSDQDTYYPILDSSHEPGVLYYYSLDVNHDFTVDENGQRSRLSTIGLQVFPRSSRQKGFLYALMRGEDFNLVPRLHAVRFKHDPIIAQRIYDSFHGGTDLFPEDILQKHWKKYNSNPMVLSNRTVIANKIHNRNMTVKEVEEEFLSLGIKVENYRPTFTKEELDEYFTEVKYGDLWAEFCSRIHIPGDINGKMMSEMIELPKNPNYRWAFERDDVHIINPDEGWVMKRYKECLV